MLSPEYIQAILAYDAEKGTFTWRHRADADARWNNRFAGATAGTITLGGYVSITINKTRYLAHRLAWQLVHGEQPIEQIDHINGVRSDNRIANLRPATNTENARNAAIARNNTSGFKGVSFHRRAGRWAAAISVNRETKYLGLFDTPEEAHAAYLAAAKLAFGEFARAA